MGAVGLGFEQRKQRDQRVFYRPDETEVDLCAAPDLVAADIDLDHLGVFGKELRVRKIGSEHQQNVAFFHGVVARTEADQTGETDVEGIVELDVLLAAQRVDDGRFERFGGRDQLGMRILAAGAAEDGDLLSGVQDAGRFAQLFVVGADERLRHPDGRHAMRRRAHCAGGRRRGGRRRQRRRG